MVIIMNIIPHCGSKVDQSIILKKVKNNGTSSWTYFTEEIKDIELIKYNKEEIENYMTNIIICLANQKKEIKENLCTFIKLDIIKKLKDKFQDRKIIKFLQKKYDKYKNQISDIDLTKNKIQIGTENEMAKLIKHYINKYGLQCYNFYVKQISEELLKFPINEQIIENVMENKGFDKVTKIKKINDIYFVEYPCNILKESIAKYREKHCKTCNSAVDIDNDVRILYIRDIDKIHNIPKDVKDAINLMI